jgi:hypothetical protein
LIEPRNKVHQTWPSAAQLTMIRSSEYGIIRA